MAKSTERPVNSLGFNEIREFWAEFETLDFDFKKLLDIFAVLPALLPFS